MKRNQNRAGRKTSRHNAATQTKIQKGAGEVRPPSISPNITLFLEAEGGDSEEIVDLTKAEYAALKHAAPRSGILMLMANAALEKINFPGAARHQPTEGSGSAAGIDKAKGLAFRFINDSGATLASLKLDERQSTLLKRVGTATGLTWDELFAFILDRQLETFLPSDDPDIFSVREDATREISTNLSDSQEYVTALRIGAKHMAVRLQRFAEKQPLPTRGFLAQLPGLFSFIEDLSTSANMHLADACAHWAGSARPALLESHAAPGSQAARPTEQRRAA
jgi:hypothetical protein